MTASTVSHPLNIVLRLEGLILLVLAVSAYAYLGWSWWTFAMLFLIPDLSFAGYLLGNRIGALAYNSMHSTIGAGLLALAAVVLAQPHALPLAAIWFAHIGFDRALGYGLKYSDGFGYTHLGRVGAAARE